MRLGAHISAAGGLFNAFPRAAEVGCDSMLIITKSNRQWAAKALTADDIGRFRQASIEHSAIFPVAVHASYLINIGSSDPALWEKSYQALKDEAERAEALGIPLLTFHPGAHMEMGEQAGLDNLAQALRRLAMETAGFGVTVCLETMAGQGTTLGYRFEQLAYLLAATGRDKRFGVCFDTCHVFAAGYDIRTPESYAATMSQFEQIVGLGWIKYFHFNDSQHPLGSRKDRHEHIGRGHIGLAGFANFLNDPRWAEHAAHLETEKDENGEEMDKVNLATLRGLIQRTS